MASTPHPPQHRAARVMVIAALLLIAIFTLRPESGIGPTSAAWCLVCGERGTTNLLLNVLLFAPLGAALALTGMRPGRVLLVAALVSGVVELLQLAVVAGRDPNLGDVANNALGAVLAALATRSRETWLRPTPRRGLALGAAGALAWMATMAVSAAAMRPAPTAAAYYGQVVPEHSDEWDLFRGRVFAPADEQPAVTRGRLPPAVAAALRDSVVLAVLVLPPSDAPRRLAPIVAVFDQQRQEIGLLAQRGDALLFRGRLGASALRLTPPQLVLPGVFAAGGQAGCARGGLPLALRGTLRAGSISLAADGGGCAMAHSARLRASQGWMLLMPSRVDLAGTTIPITALWIMAFVGAWSWWAGHALRGGRALVTGAGATWVVALGTGLVLAPTLAGLPASTWWEWASALAGAATGAVAGAAFARAHAVSSTVAPAVGRSTHVALPPA